VFHSKCVTPYAKILSTLGCMWAHIILFFVKGISLGWEVWVLYIKTTLSDSSDVELFRCTGTSSMFEFWSLALLGKQGEQKG
jgi:hypothetical protein